MSWLSVEYAERKRAAEDQVTQWVPYTNRAYAVDPLYFLANRFPVGERMPSDDGATCWYGKDDSSRIWVERQGTEFAGQFYETFYRHGRHGPEESAAYTYWTDKSAIRHEVFTYSDDGRLTLAKSQATHGSSRSEFRYTDDLLTRVDCDHSSSGSLQTLVTYDDHGEISSVTRGQEVAYRALPADTTLIDVERAFVDRLVDAVPRAVAADPPAITPECLVLSYSPGQFAVLPPLLMCPITPGEVGLVVLLTEAGSHEVYIRPGEAVELYELAGYLDQALLPTERVRALLNQACRRLADADWPFAVTDEFLVFATDLELVDLAENLQAVTTSARAAHILALVDSV